MAHICSVHPYEAAEGLCRSCGGPFCADCLVYPFGPVKPPYCVPCAVTAGGVRKSARNPTVVVPKEAKQRLKEWRKARKRDLASPPPDGVATWQRMDEADAAVDEEAAKAKADAEREALRLPPPAPETPTPPPGVNLAPPGPAGTDWRDEIDAPVATNFGPPGSSFDHQRLAEPDPDALGIGANLAFDAPAEGTRWDPTALDDGVPAPTPTPTTYEPIATTYEPAPTPTPTTYEPAPTPTPYEPAAYQPYTGPAIDREPFLPTPFDPTPLTPDNGAVPQPLVFDLAADPLAPSFGAGAPASESLADFGLGNDDPEPAAYDPLPPPPPPAEHTTFDALPRAGAPPPAAMDRSVPPAIPAMAPIEAHPAPPPAPSRPDLAGVPIRPPTPTRIPAAKSEQAKAHDAKAMLARIAALRADQDD